MTLASVRRQVEAAALAAGRELEEITVVAVSKGRSVSEIRRLYDLGHRHFGENRARELAEKAPLCPDDVIWHFIGPLQTNKARVVRGVATLLHSMDRLDLAKAWMKGPGSPPPALLQVNIGREPQKSGVGPEAVGAECEAMLGMGLPLVGVMAIPPVAVTADETRPYFASLRQIRDGLGRSHPGITQLSMGMSDDFEVAVAEGATIIRVGRAIFGD